MPPFHTLRQAQSHRGGDIRMRRGVRVVGVSRPGGCLASVVSRRGGGAGGWRAPGRPCSGGAIPPLRAASGE